jgi:hypothetical protein
MATIVLAAGIELLQELMPHSALRILLFGSLFLGLVVGAFRIFAKVQCRFVPGQWVPRPLLWWTVGIETGVLALTTLLGVSTALRPPPVEPVPFARAGLSALDKQDAAVKNLAVIQTGNAARSGKGVRFAVFGYGVATLFAASITFLWPIYLRQLARAIKEEQIEELCVKVFKYLGPGFLVWALGVFAVQTLALFGIGYAEMEFGKALTLTGLLVIQVFLIQIYLKTHQALKIKAMWKKRMQRKKRRREKLEAQQRKA